MHLSEEKMHLVEVFLPLTFPDGQAVPEPLFALVKAELTDEFGGATLYTRAPVEGVWKSGSGVAKDVLIVLEVMTKELDKDWWKDFRHRSEALFHQDELLVRATRIERI
jgi:hypothetical protein